jgi:tetratricopeptide (TPR) repeat protein
MHWRRLVLVLLIILRPQATATTAQTVAASARLADIVQRPVALRSGIGRVNEQVTTASAQAQAFYLQGVAYLHSFVWIESARSFNQALRADPNLALAHVGLSEALGELGLSEEARAASRRAQALAPGVTGRERLRIEIRASQLDAASRRQDAAVQRAYRQKLDEALAKHPEDVELLLLVGRAQDPSAEGHGMGVGSSSLSFYQRALQNAPDYFAVHHYLIHAYENTHRLETALVHAERYAREAASVPHAHHMFGHVLRRVDRLAEALAEFEAADRLGAAYLRSEQIPAGSDWHYRHNLDLLAMTYQYAGRMSAAEPVFRRSFDLPAAGGGRSQTGREWPAFLLSRGRNEEALGAARMLASDPAPLVAATGHLLVSRALQALKRLDAAAEEGNAALRRMKAIGPLGGTLLPEFQLTQGEYLLRAGQTDSARAMLRDAASKLRAQSGPDAWAQTLFSLEHVARVARELGDWTLADELAEMMRAYDETYAGTHYALGRVSEHKGHRAAARSAYATAVRRWAAGDRTLAESVDASRRLSALGG